MLEKIKLPDQVIFTPHKKDKWSGLLVLEPLHTGYGVTLGSALRRVLLSSLPGAAITSVKIKGVEHEFSTLEGVREDMITIILNLKKVRIKMHEPGPIKLSISKKGEGIVRAGDFSKNSSLEIINPDQVLAHLTSNDKEFDIEVTVEKGRGYVPIEDRDKEPLEIGTIAIDAIFTPVKNVSMDVSSARVGQITNFDKLSMEITTDGTLTPKEAVEHAAALLKDHLDLFIKDIEIVSDTEKRKAEAEVVQPVKIGADIAALNKERAEGAVQGAGSQSSNMERAIEELSLSTRTLNALYNNDVKKVKDIIKMSEQELADLQGLGGKALAEISKALKKIGLSLSGGLGGPSSADKPATNNATEGK